MRDERSPGATFAPGSIGWIDFETRSLVPITDGTDRYSRNAQAIVLAWAIGDGPVGVQAVADFSRSLTLPQELYVFADKVRRGEAIFCAHNAAFDRAVWNNATDFLRLEPQHFIDTRVQATASGLPPDLDSAARYATGGVAKDKAGKALIKLFCGVDSEATPQSHPAEWRAFLAYAAQDIVAMRALFRHTRQLPLAEWKEYWAAERVNERGVGIDTGFATAGARMAVEDRRRAAKDLEQITNGMVLSVHQVKRLIAWLKVVLPPAGRDLMVKRAEEIDEDGAIVKPGKDALTRAKVLRLIAWLEDQKTLTPQIWAALRALQIRLYGGSTTPAKFQRMLNHEVDGVIRYQYTFNGAAQTGRFSAKGPQIHNLSRESLAYEIDALDVLSDGGGYDALAKVGDDTPVSRKLSLLIRTTLVAAPGRAFCWGDWSGIEARLTPWLANDPEADRRLEVFAAVDRGQEKYDIYVRAAASISGLPLAAIDGKLRQRGKVVELACGFGGGKGALLNMAANYGMHISEDEAAEEVQKWRAANPWAQRFWGRHDDRNGSFGLWGAANSALENPGLFFPVGRVGYIYLRDYLGGSLLCRLPSGRFLTYRKIKWELVDELDDDDNRIGTKRELRFSRNMGRLSLWAGMLCENVVQATAADILRGTLRRLEEDQAFAWMPVRLHTHDEILIECDEADATEAGDWLTAEMIRGFSWSEGLPLASEATIGRWYSKSLASQGL